NCCLAPLLHDYAKRALPARREQGQDHLPVSGQMKSDEKKPTHNWLRLNGPTCSVALSMQHLQPIRWAIFSALRSLITTSTILYSHAWLCSLCLTTQHSPRSL